MLCAVGRRFAVLHIVKNSVHLCIGLVIGGVASLASANQTAVGLADASGKTEVRIVPLVFEDGRVTLKLDRNLIGPMVRQITTVDWRESAPSDTVNRYSRGGFVMVDPSVRRCESGCMSADRFGTECPTRSASLNFCRGWLVRWKRAEMVLMSYL